MLWRRVRCDYAAASLPLTFDADSHHPVILNAFSTQERMDFVAIGAAPPSTIDLARNDVEVLETLPD